MNANTGAAIIVGLYVLAAVFVGNVDPNLIEDVVPPVPGVEPPATTEGAPVVAVTRPAATTMVPPPGPVVAGRVGNMTQITPTLPPPTATTLPYPKAFDCGSWLTEFERHGATPAEIGFFFGEGIIWRETRCGGDTYNEHTGDTGICQITPLHGRSGWFYGQYWPEGWLVQFGLTPRHTPGSVRWVDACLWLVRGGTMQPGVVNRSPWKPQR